MSISIGRLFDICAKFKRALPAGTCVLCGDASPHGVWCEACDAALPHAPEIACPVCALPAAGGDVCGACLKRAPNFDEAVAAFSYDFPVDRLIQALKFGQMLNVAHGLADRLAMRIGAKPDCIVPMPLHPVRLKERGFNQSQELARRIAARLEVPLLPHACLRTKNTLPQSSLALRRRDRNVRRAFACTGDMQGRHVAVVDDVMTSGASLNEVAAVLRKAGARRISVYVVARTLPRRGLRGA